jgi:hypothetical protein
MAMTNERIRTENKTERKEKQEQNQYVSCASARPGWGLSFFVHLLRFVVVFCFSSFSPQKGREFLGLDSEFSASLLASIGAFEGASGVMSGDTK